MKVIPPKGFRALLLLYLSSSALVPHNDMANVNIKEALRNLEEAILLLREVEGVVRDGTLEAGLEFENDFTEAVNEIERLQADLTERDPER
jgi:hypothetical protein